MAGLIWFVQLVHYPLYLLVGAEQFTSYERQHMRRVTWIVVPVMLFEALIAVTLLIVGSGQVPPALAWLSLGLLAFVWVLTSAVQVPCHRILARGLVVPVVVRLVSSNWARTLAWSARLLLAVVMLLGVAG